VRLDELAAVVPGPGEEWSDALEVVTRLQRAIDVLKPAFLVDVTGQWDDPYLQLRLAHADGTDIAVVHGDGYTQITGGQLDYRHFLDTDELVAVLTAALVGSLRYVRRERFGRLVDSYFRVVGGDRRLGADSLNPGRMVAWLPGTDRRIRVAFSEASALAPAPRPVPPASGSSGTRIRA
jgi:hypothetical protein